MPMVRKWQKHCVGSQNKNMVCVVHTGRKMQFIQLFWWVLRQVFLDSMFSFHLQAHQNGFFNFDTFDVDEYEHYEVRFLF